MNPLRFASTILVAALSFAIPFTAGATVKKEGSWPVTEKVVDLEFEGTPSAGLKELAKQAGWSLVVSNAVAIDAQGEKVHVAVDDQPADAVLEALFVGHDVVAHRNGMLITVTPTTGRSAMPASAPTPPPLPPPPTIRGEDRNVFGSSIVIGKDEIVHTVTVTGGSLKVEGTVTGDLVVAGGSAKILSGGHVVGDATVFGGSLKVEDNARVDGNVGIVGGSLKRENGAIIGGRIVDEDHKGNVKIDITDEGASAKVTPEGSPARTPERISERSRLSQTVHEFGQSMTKMALLFVLGCVLLALLAPRMDRLRIEIATRPMRSFAVGLLGTVLGSVAATILLAVLCITIIGIPVAVVGVLAACIAVYGAVASVLTTFGAAVIGHRTQNAYLHLLLGCGAFLVLSAIPWLGGLVTFAVAMTAIGALLATRVGGLLERRRTAPPSGLV